MDSFLWAQTLPNVVCVCIFGFPQRSIKFQRLGRSSPFGRSSSLLIMKRKLVCAAAQDDDDDDDDDADSDNEMVAWQGFRWMLSKKDPLVSYMFHV